MNLLFSMSLSGSLVFILYLIIKPIARNYLPASWRYWLLKVSLLFYLLPYQYLKYWYIDIWGHLFPGRQQNTGPPGPFASVNSNKVILVDSNGRLHFENKALILTMLGIWGIIAVSFLLYHLIKHIYCMRDLRQITKSSVDFRKAHLPKRLARTEVSLFSNQYITTPFTVGILFPRIILPASLADRKECQMIIAHEMEHVRNYDNLVKFIWLLVMLLHWYNPLVYVLYLEICKVSEQVCDASVIQGMSEQEKEQYQLLIIEMGQRKPQVKTLLTSPFNGTFKIFKERIIVMNKTTISSKKVYIVTSLVMAAFILALSPISVLAYSQTSTYECQDEHSDLDDEGAFSTFLVEDDYQDVFDLFQKYGTEHDIFVSADGEVYILDDPDPQMMRVFCPHKWKAGILYHHVKNDDGGCTTKIYDCQVCTICKSHKDITYKGVQILVTCTHDY